MVFRDRGHEKYDRPHEDDGRREGVAKGLVGPGQRGFLTSKRKYREECGYVAHQKKDRVERDDLLERAAQDHHDDKQRS